MSRNKPRKKTKRRKPAAAGSAISREQADRLQRAYNAQITGRPELAETEYRALIAEGVRTPQLFCNLAAMCAQSARRSEADRLWRKALAIAPTFIEAQMNLAESHQQAGDTEAAANAYRQILSDHEHFVPAQYLLGNILKSQGKLDDASDCYRRIMAQQPDFTQAHATYSAIHKYREKSDPHFQLMRDLLQRPDLKSENCIHLAFALAKACEDLGDYSQAFEYLKQGNDLRAREFQYDIDSDKALMRNIAATFSKEAMARLENANTKSNRPIFIVGMPRSGTSLVEKIIASHSDVYGAGELETMFALGTSRFLSQSGNFEFQALESYAPGLFEELGRTYLEQIARLDKQASRVTDKMPLNFMMIGLIKVALPNAKIIHCVRDARDNGLSIFKQNFTTGNFRFAYKLETIAQFHNQYTDLMKHWHASLPGAIVDVRYESLTSNPEPEIRKLLSACELDFQESCLRFDKTDAVVKTASAVQVRQPMYTSSVGLWKKYAPFLGPLLDELRDA